MIHDISSKNLENKIDLENIPTSTFKIVGILAKKIFRKFLETSVIISSYKADSRYFAKNLFKWTKIQLQLSKSGVEEKEKLTSSVGSLGREGLEVLTRPWGCRLEPTNKLRTA